MAIPSFELIMDRSVHRSDKVVDSVDDLSLVGPDVLPKRLRFLDDDLFDVGGEQAQHFRGEFVERHRPRIVSVLTSEKIGLYQGGTSSRTLTLVSLSL